MRFLVRWCFRLLVLGLVAITALVLTKDLLLREWLMAHSQAETGLETRIGRARLGVLHPTLTLENVRFYNPPEFGGAPFLDVAECHFQYDPRALIEGRVRLPFVRFHLAEATLVETPGGMSNLEAIYRRLRQRAAASGPPRFHYGGIDVLNLSLGRLRRVNLGQPAQTTVIDLGVRNEVLTRLNTEAQLGLALGQLAVRVGLEQWTRSLQGIRPAPTPPGSTPVKPAR
ncbi:MAG TPA: hypothetical protein PKM73_08715 [Verrucomicrobiota bacterium]|nr:hypothetical protein [Verrucomicrobiota bacterium]HNU52450.1 hypothetical protein [Verrucomicrobiota bacterium]